METNALVGRSSASDVWMRGLFMLLLMIGSGTGQWLLGRLRAVFRRELGDDAPEGCTILWVAQSSSHHPSFFVLDYGVWFARSPGGQYWPRRIGATMPC